MVAAGAAGAAVAMAGGDRGSGGSGGSGVLVLPWPVKCMKSVIQYVL